MSDASDLAEMILAQAFAQAIFLRVLEPDRASELREALQQVCESIDPEMSTARDLIGTYIDGLTFNGGSGPEGGTRRLRLVPGGQSESS